MQQSKTKKLVLTALFIAISFVLANVKIMGTIAFDSLPAFLGVLILGNGYGAVIGFMGHMLTALLSGFPFGLPIHLITAGMMGLTMVLFSISFKAAFKKAGFIAAAAVSAVVGVLVNGPGAILALSPMLLPIMGQEGLMAFLLVLCAAALANAAIALLLYYILEKARVMERFDLK